LDEHGNLKPVHTLTREQAWPIVGIDVVKRNLTAGDGQADQVIKINLMDKTK
jgi:hypothetical protein